MTARRWKAVFICFIAQLSIAATDPDGAQLYLLEKKRHETQLKLFELEQQRQSLAEKIQRNESSLMEKKKSIANLARLNRRLKEFRIGGLRSAEDPLRYNRELKILETLRDRYVLEAREYNFVQFELREQKKIQEEQINSLEKAQQDILAQEKIILEAEKSVLERLRRADSKSILVLKGKLALPLSQQPKHDFGTEVSADSQYLLYHRGWTYQVDRALSLQAVGPGRIIFRDAVDYWGESIIVEHEGGYYSVYAGLSQVARKVGDYVKRSDVLGLTTGPEFYFEFRHRNVPLNFATWLKR
jgi:murein hydrolase activator